MQGSLKKKQSQFRNSIRRQRLEQYKKTRRKQLFQNTTSIPLQQTSDTKLYHIILQFHELNKMMGMDNQRLNNHLQMLQQLVFSQNNFVFIDAFDKILNILIDFYETIAQQSEMVLRQQFNEDVQIGLMEFFIQTNIFTFLDPYKFFKIIVGIYYQINPSRNITYLQKCIKMIKSALKFSFQDNSQMKSILLQKGIPTNLNFKINKSIPIQFLITIILNISYSQQQSVLEIIVRQGILQDLSYYIQQYGMAYNAIEPTAGLYSNCIQYLCNLIHQFPVGQEFHQQEVMNHSKINVYYLYLDLFQNLIVIQDQRVIKHMIYISQKLINVSLQSADQLKRDIFDKVYNLIGNIAMIQQYIQGSEQLFILFAHEYDFKHDPYPCRLVQLLHLIFTKNLKIYYGEYEQSQKIKYKNEDEHMIQGKVLRQIRRIFEACRSLISRFDISCLDFHQQIVKQVMSFWIKQDLIMGQEELLAFMQVAVQIGKDLSDFLIFGEFKYEFTFLMANDYQQDKEIQAVILLVNAVLTRLEEGILYETEKKYLTSYRNQMETIKQRLQSYCLTPFVASKPHLFEIGYSLGQKIDRLITIALNQ